MQDFNFEFAFETPKLELFRDALSVTFKRFLENHSDSILKTFAESGTAAQYVIFNFIKIYLLLHLIFIATSKPFG